MKKVFRTLNLIAVILILNMTILSSCKKEETAQPREIEQVYAGIDSDIDNPIDSDIDNPIDSGDDNDITTPPVLTPTLVADSLVYESTNIMGEFTMEMIDKDGILGWVDYKETFIVLNDGGVYTRDNTGTYTDIKMELIDIESLNLSSYDKLHINMDASTSLNHINVSFDDGSVETFEFNPNVDLNGYYTIDASVKKVTNIVFMWNILDEIGSAELYNITIKGDITVLR